MTWRVETLDTLSESKGTCYYNCAMTGEKCVKLGKAREIGGIEQREHQKRHRLYIGYLFNIIGRRARRARSVVTVCGDVRDATFSTLKAFEIGEIFVKL